MSDTAQQMGAHTPEPWSADIPYIHAGDTATNIGECFVNDGIGVDQMWANTRRIVACVNACKGISNERLDEMAEEDRYFGRALISKEAYAEMERQRDELLAALEGLDSAIRREQMSCHKCGERDFVHSLGVTQSLTDSEAAISRARGTAVR